ncbi:MAG: endonuclease III [Myxococcota bacterium]
MQSADPGQVRERLARAIPDPRPELDHDDAWSLLVATILSAQSTDRMVNTVTPALFARWPTPADLAAAPREEVEEVVRSTGFYRNKAKSIQGAAARIAEEHGGEVPRTMAEMVKLPGVARKTANVVLGSAYGVASGVVVDTHAGRVARRLGLSGQKKAGKVEKDLMEAWPREAWIDMGHRLVLHGRYVCTSRKPDCAACPLNEVCPSREADPEGCWTERADREARLVAARGDLGA